MKKRILFIAVLALFSYTAASAQSTSAMNLKSLHTEAKAVQTSLLFVPTENKEVSLQIEKNKQLSEHITKVPALLVCVTGKGSYGDEKGKKINLQPGDYVKIDANVKHWVDAYEDSNFLLIK